MGNRRIYYLVLMVIITILTVGIILNMQVETNSPNTYDDMENYDYHGDSVGENLKENEEIKYSSYLNSGEAIKKKLQHII